MKKLYVSHYTALTLFRYARCQNAKFSFVKQANIQSRRPSTEEIQLIGKICKNYTLHEQPIHIMVNNTKLAYKHSKVITHICNKKLSGKSFVKVTIKDEVLQKQIFDKALLPAPGILIIQLSKKIPFYRLFQWTMELYGNYTLNPSSENGFMHTEKLSSISSIPDLDIKNYLNKNLGSSKMAKYLTKWICPDSASPAETNVYIMLCGPRRHGFFQIKNLKLNKCISLSNAASKIAGQKIVIPDLSCEQHKLAIEYDSRKFHTNSSQNQKDKRRLLGLDHDGWKVVPIVPSLTKDLHAFDDVAYDIMKYCKIDTRIRTKNFVRQHIMAFKNLYY